MNNSINIRIICIYLYIRFLLIRIYMKLSKQEVQKIAKLARLELTDEEIDKFAPQLSDVFKYFEKLKKVNTENVEPTAQVTGLENVYRDDEIDQCEDQSDLVEQAGDTDGDLIKTKSVF